MGAIQFYYRNHGLKILKRKEKIIIGKTYQLHVSPFWGNKWEMKDYN